MNRRPVPGLGQVRPGQPLTPEMQRELQDRMARGEDLPPGFVAVPEGQVPPPGTIPTGVTTQPNGQPVKAPEDLTKFNPIVADQDGLTLMRSTYDCPLPNETTMLQQHIQMLTRIGRFDDEVIDVVSKGLAAYMFTSGFCGKSLKDRIAVDFDGDERLTELHAEIKTRTEEMVELKKKLQACSQAAQAAITERWDRSVKKYGLNPAKNFYAINEQEGRVYQLTIDCASCKGKAKLRKSRQAAQAYLAKVQAEQRKAAEDSAKPAVKAVKDEAEAKKEEPQNE